MVTKNVFRMYLVTKDVHSGSSQYLPGYSYVYINHILQNAVRTHSALSSLLDTVSFSSNNAIYSEKLHSCSEVETYTKLISNSWLMYMYKQCISAVVHIQYLHQECRIEGCSHIKPFIKIILLFQE